MTKQNPLEIVDKTEFVKHYKAILEVLLKK